MSETRFKCLQCNIEEPSLGDLSAQKVIREQGSCGEFMPNRNICIRNDEHTHEAPVGLFDLPDALQHLRQHAEKAAKGWVNHSYDGRWNFDNSWNEEWNLTVRMSPQFVLTFVDTLEGLLDTADHQYGFGRQFVIGAERLVMAAGFEVATDG